MKRKILLAGGTAPFEGPWVNLEKGDWLVEPPHSGCVSLVFDNGEMVTLNGKTIKIRGPSRVRAIIEEGLDEVHLDTVQVSHA